MTTRKTFLKQSALSLLGLSLLSSTKAAWAEQAFGSAAANGSFSTDIKTIRSISYNIFNGCIGYKGINGRNLPPGEQSTLIKAARDLGQIPARIMQELALYRPDIINFSEGPDEKTVAEMAEMLDMSYAFFPGGKDGSGKFPGAILTNFEILSAETRPFADKNGDLEELFTRHWGKAKLRLPNGKSIVVHSAHLWPFAKEENDTRIRLDEIAAMQAAIAQDAAGDADSILLQGDLNHRPDTEEYKRLNSGSLVDTFTAAGQGDGFTANAIKPAKRIDYIYCTGTFARHIKACRSLYEGNFRMNNEDPNGFALSDHLPVLADFGLGSE
ncbi:endonuclease/exonuclease/phosphatase family protein [Parapedobacter sp. 10938]|uniref:endonuclease/exonuclease/phosphatase family protein n=1 Tax=Parapedobacter flavus TaxID=3110225 RepID=UPI002DBB7EEE|nr:endonuclease/exonuclease/phosphatase family protein [Parapedobacter sp. 10938]MEC3880526.1 endonuclease/exonuclease/phosphatase family protein [Parapedobacter sp. 10938]